MLIILFCTSMHNCIKMHNKKKSAGMVLLSEALLYSKFLFVVIPLTSGWGKSPQPNTNTEFYIAGESYTGLCLAILQ